MKGYIHSLETFGSADGPGVRFVVFLKGCNMRCAFCHNPDTWSREDAKEYTAREILDIAVKYKDYWGKKGGITVSGGEPLLQIDFVTELFSLAKEMGINTAIDTAGQPFSNKKEFLEKFDRLLKVTDLFLVDIKQMDEKEHIKLTKVGNKNILEMIKYINANGGKMWIRHVLIPGVTDEEEQLKQISDFMGGLENVEKVQVLPYHTLGKYKWDNLGLCYPLGDTPSPDKKSVEKAREILRKK